jgi:hypothetical protein
VNRWLRLAVVAAAVLAAVVPIPQPWIETNYSQRLYLVLQRGVTAWSNALPIAVTDVLIGGALLAMALAVRTTLRTWKRRGPWAAAKRATALGATAAALVYLAFVVMWGLNYRREPLAGRLDFDRSRVTPESVGDLARRVVGRLNALYPRVNQGPWPDWAELPAVLGPSFDSVQRQLARVSPATPGVPKWSVLTYYFERAGVSGMTDPFALEVLVDRAQLPFERPFVTAHEWAHLAGYSVEAEANFIGWLVCFQGPPSAEYSGQLVLLTYLLGALPPVDARATLRALAPGPRADLAAIGKRSQQTWPWLQRPAWWVYDRYLRANRVPQGVRSYAAALQLVAGTRYEKAWVPMLRR